MRIIIAPNAFKGSLSAEEAAEAIAGGLRASKWDGRLTLFPVADGGDDTASLLTKSKHGETLYISVHDPLGRMIHAPFGWMADKKEAVIGLSDASGLRLVKKEELDPLRADTLGTGELIKAALDKGVQKMIIGVGGSATVDGGTGMLKALGIRFLNKAGDEIHLLPAGLAGLETIDTSGLDKRIFRVEIMVLCDVQNKLLGDEGAAKIFGPQKGADKGTVVLLEKCMQRWNEMTKSKTGTDMSSLPYSGAAGGAAAGLTAYTHAKPVNGIDLFLNEMHFDEVLEKADLVITGEGSIDKQTLEGKGPLGVARRAKEKNVPVIGLAGKIPAKPSREMHHYFDELVCINPVGMALEEAIRTTGIHLTRTAFELGNQLAEDRNV